MNYTQGQHPRGNMSSPSQWQRKRCKPRFTPLTFEPLEPRNLLALAVQLVADLNPGPSGIDAGGYLSDAGGSLIVAANTGFFIANDGTHGVELWKTDGSAAGTAMVKDINPGSPSSSPDNLTAVGGTLFFRVRRSDHDELWKSDGTSSGTVPVWSSTEYINNITNVNGKLFFRNKGTELWVSDGTSPGTVFIKGGFEGSSPDFFFNFNGTLFFRGNHPTQGTGTWKSDGTPSGTLFVTEKWMTGGTVVNGTRFFRGYDESHGSELWKSDGTAAGTVLVKDIYPGPNGSPGWPVVNVNGTLFFSARNGPTDGEQLWKSDGTEAGTVMVHRMNPSFNGSQPTNLANVNGILYYGANDGVNGFELWKSDGTAAGTVMVKDIAPGASGSEPEQITAVPGGLVFFYNGANGRRLWFSDGTEAGTVMVADPLGAVGGRPIVSVNSKLLFIGHDATHGNELRAAIVTTANTYAPIASNKTFTTLENAGVATPLMASDGDSDPLTFYIVDLPKHGSLGGTAPNLTYTPNLGYVGPDSFTYRASDGTFDSNLATFAIDVISRVPVAKGFSVQTRVTKPVGIALSATNPNSLSLSYTVISAPSHGTLGGTAPNLTYTPAIGYIGPDAFTYQVSDGLSTSNVATVSIMVTENHAPTADDVLLFMSSFDPLIARLSGSDADGDPLTYQVVTPPRHGTVVSVGGQLKYVPAATDQVEDFFTYQASDGIAVSNVANALILLFQFRIKVFAEDGAQDIADVGHTLFASVPPGGSPDVSFTTSSGTPALFSQQPQIDSSGALKFTPAANAQGTAVVTVVLHSGAQGEESSNDEEPTATFEIEIDQRYPWQNDTFWADGNDDDKVTSSDALLVIDYINGIGPGPVSDDSSGPYYDISGNNYVSALDALSVINIINAVGAFELGPDQPDLGGPGSTEPGEEGEPAAVAPALARDFTGELYSLLAADIADQLTGRRKRT